AHPCGPTLRSSPTGSACSRGCRAAREHGAERPGVDHARQSLPIADRTRERDGPLMHEHRRYVLLAVLCGSLFVVSLDSTIVNVALPTIGRELGSDVATLQWTVDAYLLVLAALLLLSGSLADRIGRQRVFGVGVMIFT